MRGRLFSRLLDFEPPSRWCSPTVPFAKLNFLTFIGGRPTIRLSTAHKIDQRSS